MKKFYLFFFSPWRIVDDCGGAFTMGAIGGGIFQAIKGFRNSPVVSKIIFVCKLSAALAPFSCSSEIWKELAGMASLYAYLYRD